MVAAHVRQAGTCAARPHSLDSRSIESNLWSSILRLQRPVHQPFDVGDRVEDALANLRVMQCPFLSQPAQGALRQLCGDDDIQFIDYLTGQNIQFAFHSSTSPR